VQAEHGAYTLRSRVSLRRTDSTSPRLEIALFAPEIGTNRKMPMREPGPFFDREHMLINQDREPVLSAGGRVIR
jgi:hypothetical protein